uniref:Bestrophin homolog n=1 Tax=Caenorhabditis tropicalis TaxID=1561998 RepID=A0A1I7TW49_9PELO
MILSPRPFVLYGLSFDFSEDFQLDSLSKKPHPRVSHASHHGVRPHTPDVPIVDENVLLTLSPTEATESHPDVETLDAEWLLTQAVQKTQDSNIVLSLVETLDDNRAISRTRRDAYCHLPEVVSPCPMHELPSTSDKDQLSTSKASDVKDQPSTSEESDDQDIADQDLLDGISDLAVMEEDEDSD